MRKERKHSTAEEKVAVLRRHLLDKVPISDLSEELSLKPTVFYAGKRSSSRTERRPFRLKSVPMARWRRSRNGLSSWRRR
jgi:transposase